MQITACFSPLNPEIRYIPFQCEWGPLGIPPDSQPTAFWQGIRTIAGHGDSTQQEGLAVHQYAANVSMKNEAFVNHDGDYMIVPQQGRLDIQTETGRYIDYTGILQSNKQEFADSFLQTYGSTW